MSANSKKPLPQSSERVSEENRTLLISAPSSGSGKTTVTLGLLRAFKRRNLKVKGLKAGPDFIDPGFHSIASGMACENVDPWGMQEPRILNALSSDEARFCLIEGMMGLFDGAADGSGSAASLARATGSPVLLVVDAAKQSHSIAALVRGFRDHDPDVRVAGVILNKVGSERHEAMLKNALKEIDVHVYGSIPKNSELEIPERHLGLVQAQENSKAEALIDCAANLIEAHCDLDGIAELFSGSGAIAHPFSPLNTLGTHVAIARDAAFSFCYPHLCKDWRSQSAELSFFSPLADETPSDDATAIYLPGGYPELHCEKLSSAKFFIEGLLKARERGVVIYGECGGYMVLGKGLTDAGGKRHEMAGLLDLETSFAKPKLHLGYRRLVASDFAPGDTLTAHEFHYSTALKEIGRPLFKVEDALGNELGSAGLRDENVMGSYMHVIDRWIQ